MECRKFKEQNCIFAENQPEYFPLPAYKDNTPQGMCVFSFKLSEEEIKQINDTGTIYLKVLTFNKPLQPLGFDLLNPFIK